jgi:hypothetical protein
LVVFSAAVGAVFAIVANHWFIPWAEESCIKPLCQLHVAQPEEDALVGPYELAAGKTPYGDRSHYLLVTPIETGKQYLQGPMLVAQDGTWSGVAVFGDGKAGCGQTFGLLAIATKESLTPGEAREWPADAPASSQVAVTRIKEC